MSDEELKKPKQEFELLIQDDISTPTFSTIKCDQETIDLLLDELFNGSYSPTTSTPFLTFKKILDETTNTIIEKRGLLRALLEYVDEGSGFSAIMVALRYKSYQFILDLVELADELSLNWFRYELLNLIVAYDTSTYDPEDEKNTNMLYILHKKYGNTWDYNKYPKQNQKNQTPFLRAVWLQNFVCAKLLYKFNQEMGIDCTTSLELDTGRNALHLFYLGSGFIKEQFLGFLLEDCKMGEWAVNQKDEVNGKLPHEYRC